MPTRLHPCALPFVRWDACRGAGTRGACHGTISTPGGSVAHGRRAPAVGRPVSAVWLVLWLGCLLGRGVCEAPAAPETPIVNLYRGEINGTRFSALTAETLRTLLGAPSPIEEPERPQEGQETSLLYHAFGLAFAMHPPRGQAPLQCWRVRLYLTTTWDAKANRAFMPFSGRLSKQISQDWTPQRIETEFRQWYPTRVPQEHAAGLAQEHQRGQTAHETYQVLALDMGDFRLTFFYAHTAQRLQVIELTLPRTVPQKP